jgi:hypothetical protein
MWILVAVVILIAIPMVVFHIAITRKMRSEEAEKIMSRLRGD